MKIFPVAAPAFSTYGRVLEGYDFSGLAAALREGTPMPASGFRYEAGVPALEALPVFSEIRDRGFGGMPVQLGFCNGRNAKLNCLEYHKTSEFCIAATPLVLMLGLRSDIADGRLDSARVRAFRLPAGTGVEIFAGTLHYAPCHLSEEGFFMACALPLGTNGPAPELRARRGEDRFLAGRNKWLIAHPDAPEARAGAAVAIEGENLCLGTSV